MKDFSFAKDQSEVLHECLFKFIVIDHERFHSFSHIFEKLKEEKGKNREKFELDNNEESDEEIEKQVKEEKQKREKFAEEIFLLFDDQSLSHFWWPSKKEMEDYMKRWRATSREQRKINPYFQTPWTFSSMIDSILTGEYQFSSCQLITSNIGILVFQIYSFPYGSSDAIQALIEAFDFEIISSDLGNGEIVHNK